MAQPPPSRLSARAILSLPSRLCNPPPAVGKVRSCAVTPVLDVRLDDVLARRHLPPIGLKDLEEYLLYVERSPENLYFILWLNDYTARYHAWAQREKSSRLGKKPHKDRETQNRYPYTAQGGGGGPAKYARRHVSVPPTPDPSLAMFYLRAKQTFFTPNGEYELNIPSDVLAPFHVAPHNGHHLRHQDSRSSLWHSQSVHPDPAVFTEVAIEARGMLNESLKRFVKAAYTNVGSQRAVCGIVAGCVFSVMAGIVPLVLTTGRWNIGPHGRMIRLAAIPGLWFGLTVLISSLQGICLMIYVFGDLRQLRKFELARPTISNPIPMAISPPLPFRSTHPHGQTLHMPRSTLAPEKAWGMTSPAPSSADSPTTLTGPTRPYAHFSSTTLADSRDSCDSESCSSIVCNEINVSPAFFDDAPAPEGPATASALHRPEYRLSPPLISYVEPAHVRQESWPRRPSVSAPTPPIGAVMMDPIQQSTRSVQSSVKSPYGYGPTAGFIPSDYHYGSHSTVSLSETTRSLRSQRSARYFDFDMLPFHVRSQQGSGDVETNGLSSAPNVVEPCPPCAVVTATASSPLSHTGTGVGALLGRAQYKCNNPKTFSGDAKDPSSKRHTKWSSLTVLIPSFTAGVPAFAAPLTQVQSPVVKRAQWEVVVKAALVSAAITGVLTGVIVGVVP